MPDRSSGWELRMFAETLSAEVSSLCELRRDAEYGVTFARTRRVDTNTKFYDWHARQVDTLQRFLDIIEELLSRALREALGASECEGDADKIMYVAKKTAQTYKALLTWSLELRAVTVPEDYKVVTEKTAKLGIQLADQLADWITRVRAAASGACDDGIPIDLTFAPTLSDEAVIEMKRICTLHEQQSVGLPGE